MAIVGVQKGAGGEDGFQNGFQEVAKTVQDGAKMGQDAAKTRENESKKCGHSRQIRCFCKVGEPPADKLKLDRKLDRDGQDKSCRRKWPRNDKDGAKIG